MQVPRWLSRLDVRPPSDRPPSPWRWLVPVVCAVAGVLFATSARVSRGTELRSPESANLAGLVRTAEQKVTDESDRLAVLQRDVQAATDQAGQDNSGVGAAQAKSRPLRAPAGLTAVHGPGLMVVLDDAHGEPDDPTVDLNQLVVHQSDLQSVVNALWGGGAEAMSIAGQRIIATSAVRCVGNTLLLNGRVFSPPFRVEAIGPADQMQDSLDHAPGVTLFKQAAGYYGLGYTVESQDAITLGAYAGPIGQTYARVLR
ncbi:MAG TPA: DUF881 domain-containing protein [Jatrophihabitantaceae bacterium]